jgi:transcription elongation factor GreA
MNAQTHFAPSVGVGSTVYLRDLESDEQEMYTLTGPGDANIRHNCISTMTPIGRAIYGRRPGEIVEFEAPGGTIVVEIVAIESKPPLQLARDG